VRVIIAFSLIALSCTSRTENKYIMGAGGTQSLGDASFGGGSGGQSATDGSADVSSGGAAGANSGGTSGAGATGGTAATGGSGLTGGAGGTAGIGSSGGTAGTGGTGGTGGAGGTGGTVSNDAGTACANGCGVADSCVNGFCETVVTISCAASCPAAFPVLVKSFTQLYECDADECAGGAPPGLICAVSPTSVTSQPGGPSCPSGNHLAINVLECTLGSFNFCIAN
jgi:hypothetical protein